MRSPPRSRVSPPICNKVRHTSNNCKTIFNVNEMESICTNTKIAGNKHIKYVDVENIKTIFLLDRGTK